MKPRHLPALLIFFFLSPLFIFSQQRCASYEHLVDQLREDPVFRQNYQATEKNFDNYISIRNSGINSRAARVTIPVVVHVVYNTNAQNISDAQVQSQIDVLDHDFDATNTDYGNYAAGYSNVRGDANIQFCLVLIKRVKTKSRSFSTNDNVKKSSKGGSDPVDPTRYLNIWVCDLGQGLLGYAQFPGGPESTDGVVIDYQACGKGNYNLYSAYDLGRTATHEIGHWLGLRHIWGDATCGDDFVGDTPLHNTANYGCPGVGHLSLCTGTPLEMWMNYMDYTDDQCMYFFSAGQVTRMDFYLDNNTRLKGIINNADCTPITDNGGGGDGGGGTGPGHGNGNGNPGGGNPHGKLGAGDIQVYPTLTTGIINIRINAINEGTATINIFNQAGALVYKQQVGVEEGENNKTISLSNLASGTYILQYSQNEIRRTQKIIVQQ